MANTGTGVGIPPTRYLQRWLRVLESRLGRGAAPIDVTQVLWQMLVPSGTTWRGLSAETMRRAVAGKFLSELQRSGLGRNYGSIMQRLAQALLEGGNTATIAQSVFGRPYEELPPVTQAVLHRVASYAKRGGRRVATPGGVPPNVAGMKEQIRPTKPSKGGPIVLAGPQAEERFAKFLRKPETWFEKMTGGRTPKGKFVRFGLKWAGPVVGMFLLNWLLNKMLIEPVQEQAQAEQAAFAAEQPLLEAQAQQGTSLGLATEAQLPSLQQASQLALQLAMQSGATPADMGWR